MEDISVSLALFETVQKWAQQRALNRIIGSMGFMQGDGIIGFIFAFVDISAAIEKTKGCILPFGWITLKREFI